MKRKVGVQQLCLNVPAPLHRALVEAARKSGTSMADFIRSALSTSAEAALGEPIDYR